MENGNKPDQKSWLTETKERTKLVDAWRRAMLANARKFISGIAMTLMCSSTVTYAQVAGPGPAESPREYNMRYARCNDITARIGKYGYTPEWNQCMRDTYAPRTSASPPPKKLAVPVAPRKSQNAGNLADTAKVDPAWADDTRKRIAKKADDPVEIAHMEDNAPYGDPRCAVFKPAPHRGAIDWDWVKVTNRCSYPIGVLSCYYDVGQERDCLPGGKGSWGLGHLAPGKTDTSVATSQRMPWMVKAIVCNMTPQKHNRMLCVLPDRYKKP